MIRRTFESAFLNSVINHPDVRPWVYGEGELDVTAALLNPDNFALVTEGGGFILMRHEPGIYECHTQFLPGKRMGAVKAMWDAFEYMFTRTDCEKVVTQVPDNNAAAVKLAQIARFRRMFRREDTPRGPTAFMGLSIDEWAQDNSYLEADGEWLHLRFDEIAAAAKVTWSDHPEDKGHNRVAGAAVSMIRADNAGKGVNFYNRWARLAGYPTIRIVQEIPLVIDMSAADAVLIVEIRDGDLEALLCR